MKKLLIQVVIPCVFYLIAGNNTLCLSFPRYMLIAALLLFGARLQEIGGRYEWNGQRKPKYSEKERLRRFLQKHHHAMAVDPGEHCPACGQAVEE